MPGLMRITVDYTTGKLYTASLDVNDGVYSEIYEENNTQATYPRLVLGQKFNVNLKLLNITTPIPANATCNVIIDNDYNNDTPYVPLLSADSWTVRTGSEYQYNYVMGNKPQAVLFDGAAATEGTLGALSEGEWAWNSTYTRIVVRITGSTSPASEAEGYVSVKDFPADNMTYPFIEIDTDTVNLASSWYGFNTSTGVYSYRNPSPANGEFTFQLNGNTYNLYQRMGSSNLITNATMQTQIYNSTHELIGLVESFFIFRNKYVGTSVESLELNPSNFYSKAEIDAFYAGKNGGMDIGSIYSLKA
jgi:hypothetical protein